MKNSIDPHSEAVQELWKQYGEFYRETMMKSEVLPDQLEEKHKFLYTAKCVENVGMEDKFDVGVEYVSVERPCGEVIDVYDKNGLSQQCFADRFEVFLPNTEKLDD